MFCKISEVDKRFIKLCGFKEGYRKSNFHPDLFDIETEITLWNGVKVRICQAEIDNEDLVGSHYCNTNDYRCYFLDKEGKSEFCGLCKLKDGSGIYFKKL